tara:strand:- start:189 stop:665 length:477 start_codon:yes stop_codon:yes gene_type:complete
MKEIKQHPNKPGRKLKTLSVEDTDKITQLAATGLGILDICKSLGISWNVWQRESKKSEIMDALKKGESLGRAKIVNSLYQNALKGSVPSQIFWLKNKGGEGEWQDRQETEININLKDVLEDAKLRVAQQNNNTRIIDGESLDITDVTPGEHLPKKKSG